ncbi:FAD dependent oxidoreductase [Rickenella mellea]|uniref:FAD dependent oxidoreductase n=1 Tax=Rickenella mellea TaxID=50990 RepID=A0A4Y7PNH8_9AGAM|nr:FAD dependent oxidoreductase [Rickenella mellea]
MSASEITPYSPPKDIVIIGAGIIGCTSAYYLSRHPLLSSPTTPIKITILEAGDIAGGASGKAGGLVAKWAYPKELVDASFAEHVKLAKEHGGAERWGWRMVACGEWRGRVGGSGKKGKTPKGAGEHGVLPEDLDWVESEATEAYEPMAEDGETAQVHPYLFTASMLALAQEKGVKLVEGRATSIQYTPSEDTKDRYVSGVKYVDTNGVDGFLPVDTIILSAGPWTPTLLPQAPISGHRAHSITIRPSHPVSAYALFTSFTYPIGTRTRTATPEIYARPNNEVYACAPGDDEPLPKGTKDVLVDEKVCDQLVKDVGVMSKRLRDGEVTARQACYLPNVNSGPRGCPIVGRVEGVGGLVVAAGHTCWGICNAPGTAKAISELVMDGEITCANLSRLAPRNFF